MHDAVLAIGPGNTLVLRPARSDETANILFVPYMQGAITFAQGTGRTRTDRPRTVASGPFSGCGFAAGTAANGQDIWGAHIACDANQDRTGDWASARDVMGLRVRVDERVNNPIAGEDLSATFVFMTPTQLIKVQAVNLISSGATIQRVDVENR